MAVQSSDVERYLAALDHPLKAGVLRLRTAILAADPGITEHVKWNAPSFRYAGEDRVTFQLRRPDRVQLVFHRGAQVRADTDSFAFDDPTGLLQWATPDRAVVTLTDLAGIDAQVAAVGSLVARWVVA